jgi:NAD(P)-dependent dehydrogenase (short-subunit alcohol dehydrogenase family)
MAVSRSGYVFSCTCFPIYQLIAFQCNGPFQRRPFSCLHAHARQRAAAEGKGCSMDNFYDEMGGIIPMGRVGTTEEFANVALFLAYDAGSYVTGTAIDVDGGMSPVT